MKYIKTYENILNSNKFLDITKLEVGDYILLNIDDGLPVNLIKYLNNNVGQIAYQENLIRNRFITVNFFETPNKNIPIQYFLDRDDYQKKYNIYQRVIDKYYITAISKNKEDLEIKLAANKYNIG